jgi:hypothetical protein
VCAHKLALMAQRQFWNALLRDSVPFMDLLVSTEISDQVVRAHLMYCHGLVALMFMRCLRC